MIRDHDGDPVSPRDVLDDEELADYYAARRRQPPPMRRPKTTANRWDELGYDRDTGQWRPDKDGAA